MILPGFMAVYNFQQVTYLHSVTFELALFIRIHPVTNTGDHNNTEDDEESDPELPDQRWMLIHLKGKGNKKECYGFWYVTVGGSGSFNRQW